MTDSKTQKNGLSRGHFKIKPINSSYWRELFLVMRAAQFPSTPEWYEEAEIYLSDLSNILGVFKGSTLVGGVWVVIKNEPCIDVVVHPDYHGKWATKQKCARAVKALMDVHELDVVYAETTNPRAKGLLSKLGFKHVISMSDTTTSMDYVVDYETIASLAQ